MPAEAMIRTQWYGIRATDPSTAGLAEGVWWYNSTQHVLKYWDGTNIIIIGGGGKVYTGTDTTIVATAGDYVITVTIVGVTTINHIMDIQFDTSPDVDPGTPIGPVISGTVVGFTLVGVGAGTTITSTVKVLGW